MEFNKLFEAIVDDAVTRANRTARFTGAVGAKAITPRYVAETIKPGEKILNFGAGIPDKTTGKYFHSEQIRAKGGIVDEYDFGDNAVGSLKKGYQTVFASNVLNVQSTLHMLKMTLDNIKYCVGEGGRAVFNYPLMPRLGGMSNDEVAAAIEKVFGTPPVRVGGTRQAPIWEVKPDSAPKTSTLRTLKNTPVNRYQSVGKRVGFQIYVHKNYMEDVIPAFILDQALMILKRTHPKFKYNSVMYNTMTGDVRFDEAPDFDTAREPHVGDMVKVDKHGNVTTGHSDNIWHHKWMWVKDDYQGFDIEKNREWSKHWLSKMPETAKGTDESFQQQLNKYKIKDTE